MATNLFSIPYKQDKYFQFQPFQSLQIQPNIMKCREVLLFSPRSGIEGPKIQSQASWWHANAREYI